MNKGEKEGQLYYKYDFYDIKIADYTAHLD